MSVTIGSLFSGIGGLELGLEMCGLGPVIWQCDSDPYARAVLEWRWPRARRYDDVRSIDAKTERPGILCGGFPCQPVSLAGGKKAQRDTRWLWPFFASVVAALRPAFVFVENVPGLRTRGLRDVLADLAALGFDAEWDSFSARETGAPHVRRRLFLLAHSNGLRERRAYAEAAAELWREPRSRPASIGHGGWEAEPALRRVDDGSPAWAHRTRLLGNACVPAQAALAWRTLTARLQPPTLPE